MLNLDGHAMKLVFLGTRGYIDERTRRHFRHASLLIKWRRRAIMIDCGADWTSLVGRLRPDAIVITHAHPDHADGLKAGVDCPVYATSDSWQLMDQFPIRDRHILAPRSPVKIFGVVFQAFPVDHALRAPAVGFRITGGGARLFYVPDLVSIQDRSEALSGVALYVGDGATLTRPLVRRRGNALFGHTTVRAQLGWCQKEGVPRAIFTHCGSEIVSADGRSISAKVRAMGRRRGVKAQVAYDGLEVALKTTYPRSSNRLRRTQSSQPH
jgi:phosphoribosyl 1,2-cyclic phosphodiesterase